MQLLGDAQVACSGQHLVHNMDSSGASKRYLIYVALSPPMAEGFEAAATACLQSKDCDFFSWY